VSLGIACVLAFRHLAHYARRRPFSQDLGDIVATATVMRSSEVALVINREPARAAAHTARLRPKPRFKALQRRLGHKMLSRARRTWPGKDEGKLDALHSVSVPASDTNQGTSKWDRLLAANASDLWSMLAKRSFDLLVASGLLIISAPVLLAIVIIVRSDGGPAFYIQERVGRAGRRFSCYKFRTMAVDAEMRLARLLIENPRARAEWIATQKLKDDPRITGVGHWLRRTSIDELPQLLNVLRGDMSLVGPRPIPTPELAYYGPKIVDYVQERPGITGLWQVSGRNNLSYQARIELNSRYVKNRTLSGDIKILAKTISVVFTGRGAY
jgi:lipopolysaccharide/colanic/teichoic acid biosynthesis glycosyltransferase